MAFPMKKIFLLSFSLFCALQMWAWGRMGHAVVAQVAENHLTPAARAAMDKYLRGNRMAQIASYADTYRSVWTMDLGFHPTNPEYPRVTWLKGFDFTTPTNIIPMSHSITVYGDKFKPADDENDHGAYVHNCAYNLHCFAKQLKRADKMDDEDRFRKLCWIIHLIGDMHCPQHIIYIPKDPVKGAFKVKHKGKEINYHGFWDRDVVEGNFPGKDIQANALIIDKASAKEIKEVTKGNIFKWMQKDAASAWEAHKYQSGDTLPDDAIEQAKDLTYSQLRNAGYRLAVFLNRIFK